jgi:hypothetical protein
MEKKSKVFVHWIDGNIVLDSEKLLLIEQLMSIQKGSKLCPSKKLIEIFKSRLWEIV